MAPHFALAIFVTDSRNTPKALGVRTDAGTYNQRGNGKKNFKTGFPTFAAARIRNQSKKARMNHKALCGVFLLASIVVVRAAGPAVGQNYSITDLGASLGTNSHASGINNQGQVVGDWHDANGTRAFLYGGGTFSDLGSLGGTNHFALSINSSGQVVGFGESAEGVRAFFFSNGAIRNLGALGGLNSYAWGLNDIGQIVGHVTFSNNVSGYIYGAGGVTNLGTLGGSDSYGFGVNNSSLVVGSGLNSEQKMNAFLWNNGVLSNLNEMLPAHSGWELQEARGINNSSAIVGWGRFEGVEQAFVFKNGQVTGLGVLAGATNSYALGINNLGQVVGSGTRADGVSQAFLWDGESLINLNSLLAANSGWDLQDARGINDAGQIVGWGMIGGQEHAFLLSPGETPTNSAASNKTIGKAGTGTQTVAAELRKSLIIQQSYRAGMQTAMSLVGTNGRYAYFAFSDTNWLGERGQMPLANTNVQNVASWAGNCLSVTTNAIAVLKYRDVENNGSTNVAWWNGTIRFWLSPSWNSSNGPGRVARLIEVGNVNNTNGWWALLVNSNGTSMYLVTQTNGLVTTNVSTTISFTSNQWYCVALTYATNSSAIYLNGTLANSGLGITSIPSPSIRSNGFSIGSDWQGNNQANCHFDEMDTFDHPLASQDVSTDYQSVSTYDTDADGLPDIQEFILGTDPNNPDTDGDGLTDGFEVMWGLNPLVWNDPNADSDYDGRTDLQEQGDGTNPLDPNSVQQVQLGYWRFSGTNCLGEQGQIPVFYTNLQSVGTWVGKGLRISGTNTARLTYRDVETNHLANINCRSGSVVLWFRPDWSSSTTNSGSGPQNDGRVIEMGTCGGTNDWWALLVSSNGTAMRFQTQTNGVGTTNLVATINWVSNQWHQIALTFTPSNSTLYLDGQVAVALGTGVSYYPRLSIRTNGFSIGSDMAGANQAKGTYDELQTFNYPLNSKDIWTSYELDFYRDSDADGLSDMMELQLGTDPNNPDTDGDGLLDGFEVQYGMNPLVWNDPTADSDYDGRTAIQEQADGADPTDPNSVATVRLGYWRFNDTTWRGEEGQIPFVASNLTNVPSWSTNALLVNSLSTAQLTYRDVETNGSANINCRNGSLRFWFKPNWLTGTTNGGPGCEAGLIEMGTRSGSDWWALSVSSDGTQVHFCTRTNGIGMTNLAAIVDWQSNQWHQVVLTYSPSNSSFYLDGQPFEINGAAAAYYPRLSIRANGFSIGSDLTGSNQARGTFEELETFNYPLLASDILVNYSQIMQIDSDGNGVPDVLQDEGVLPPSTNGVPALPANTLLNHWCFNDTNWLTGLGYGPRSFTNLVCTPSWSSNALWIDSSNPSFLRYNVFENDSHTNITVENGTVSFWFNPDWSSASSGGSGPGVQGRLIEVGRWTTNANYGCWSLHFDSAGSNIIFEAQNQLGGSVFLQSNINWVSNVWHYIVLEYSSSNSVLYLDGSIAATGSGVVRWPSLSVQLSDGMSIGSDETGVLQAKGQFENLQTFTCLRSADSIQNEYSTVEAILNPLGDGLNNPNGSQGLNGFGPMDDSSSTNLSLQIGPGTNHSTLTLTLFGTVAGKAYRVFSRPTVGTDSSWQSGVLITGLANQTAWNVTNNGSNVFYTVAETPQITTQPVSQTVLAGSNVTFTVSATGADPLSYQWRFNGASIAGATNGSYVCFNAQPTNAGNYSVVITNVGASVTSSNAALTVNVPPSISQQPTNQTVNQGTNVSFAVTASGTTPLAYQWRLNGTNVVGATNTVYTCSNVQPNNAGYYTVLVTNVAGSVTSANALLTIIGSPSITTQPSSQAVNVGGSVTFNVAASGTAPLAYQWRFNGANIGGATNTGYTITSVQATNAGNYSVAVTNAAGVAISSNAVLTVNVFAPGISVQPVSVTNNQGASVNFSVSATGTSPLAYQWYFNAASIAGATGATLNITSIQPTNAGNYFAVITNMAGSVTSSVVSLTVNGPPTITTQPNSQTNTAGSTIVFSVVASGTPQLVYQWSKNGAALTNFDRISGADTARLQIIDLGSADGGSYSVTITNMAGQTTSTNATLTVNTNALLGRWHFDTNTWIGQQGQVPLISSNLVIVTGCSNTAVQIDSTNAAVLAYRDVETNNSANVSIRQGSIRFYFAPDWNSGAGPGNEGRFAELGSRDSTNGWWALTVSSDGTLLSFITQTNEAGITNLVAPVNWQASQWHQVVLTYCSTNSSAYVDGQPVTTNGQGVTYWPGPTVRAQGFRIGSDATGARQVRGILDELETFNYPLLASDVAASYAASALLDTDGDGLPDAIEASLGKSASNPQSNNDGISDYFEWLHGLSAQGIPSLNSVSIPSCPE